MTNRRRVIGSGADTRSPGPLGALTARDLLRYEAAYVRSDYPIPSPDVLVYRDDVARLIARVAALDEALLRYGAHEDRCPWMRDALPCTCGYLAWEADALSARAPDGAELRGDGGAS